MANPITSTRSWPVTTATVTLLVSLLLGVLAAPVAQAGTTPCRVANVTQDTHGTSFKVMVKAAVDGDHLTVRGTCEGDVTIRTDLVITGIGDPRPVLTGRHRHRVLAIGRSSTLVVRHLVIADGTTAASGGGIANNGTLTLIDSVVKGSTAYYGGGISNDGSLNLTDAVVRGNGAGVSGGGILNHGTLTMIRSVVRDNRTDAGSGGGIASLGALTLTDSVVRGNTGYNGGGILNWGALTLRRSSQVTANTATESGGGIWNNEDSDLGVGTVIVRGGSSVTGNTPDDCAGTTAC